MDIHLALYYWYGIPSFVRYILSIGSLSCNSLYCDTYLLITRSRTNTHSSTHSRRNAAEAFDLNKFKPAFSRRPRTLLQSCSDRVSESRFMTQRIATTSGPAGRRGLLDGEVTNKKIDPNNSVGLVVSCPTM